MGLIVCVLAFFGTLALLAANSHHHNQRTYTRDNRLLPMIYACQTPEDSQCEYISQKDMINDYSYDDYDNERTKKRLPDAGCNCRNTNAKVDLGIDFFPRWIMNLTCQNDKCTSNTYCARTIYPLKVLTRRLNHVKIEKDEPGYSQLPQELKKCWKFHTVIDVVVDCMCTYDYK